MGFRRAIISFLYGTACGALRRCPSFLDCEDAIDCSHARLLDCAALSRGTSHPTPAGARFQLSAIILFDLKVERSIHRRSEDKQDLKLYVCCDS